MEGKSAENLKQSLAIAENKHTNVADGHSTKSGGYSTTQTAVEAARSKMYSIDSDAHEKIREIEKLKTHQALKLVRITEIVTQARADAINAAADVTETILAEAGNTLTETGQDKSVNDLTKALDSKYKLDMPASTPEMPEKAGSTGAGTTPSPGDHATAAGNNMASGAGSGTGSGTGPNIEQAGNTTTKGLDELPAATPAGVGSPVAPVTGGPGSNGGALPGAGGVRVGPTLPGGGGGSGGGGIPRLPGGGGGGGAPSMPAVAEGLTPASVAKNFSSGMMAGGPASLESHAAASSVMNAATGGGASHPPPVAPPSGGVGAAPVVVSSGPVQPHVVEAQAGSPVVSAPQAAPVVQPVMAPPPPPMAAPPPPPPPVPPAGPLPAYAADLRAAAAAGVPPAPAVPPAPPVMPPGGGAVSTSPSSGSSLSPTVVNRPSSPAAPVVAAGTPAAAALGATTGAASGEVVGSVAKAAEQQQRCDDAVMAMAAQEPRLRWAVGIIGSDPRPLVVTDLAGGWLPGHVRPPADARLIDPDSASAVFGVPVDAMLAGSAFQSVYSPGEAVRAVRVGLSDWPCKLEPVADIRSELRRASDWRDGLPRLAFAMAKAWALSAGVRPMEVDRLREYIAQTADHVLRSYQAGPVDPHMVGNWALAQAIDAFNSDQYLLGTYHFRWFRRVAMAGADAVGG